MRTKINLRLLFSILFIFLLTTALISLRYGAVSIELSEILTALSKMTINKEDFNLNERIFLEIRAPRTLLCIIIGAILSVSGVILQALFRNPIVEPGLIGTSSGAAFGASIFIVLGSNLTLKYNIISLPIFACLGGCFGTFLVLVLSSNGINKSISQLLLVGVAVNALFLSGIGFMGYIARDPQARSISFWNLGTISGANWESFQLISLVGLIGIFISYRLGKPLNTLILGENEAKHLGVNVQKLKFWILGVNIIMISITTAYVGVIGFIGLIVPHLLRSLSITNNKQLVLFSALLGAIVLSIADFIARNILSPAELPIGIVTSLVGVPLFIILLRKGKYYF